MGTQHDGIKLPQATAKALAAHLLGDTIASTPDVLEAAAAQVGEILVVEATFEAGPYYDREWSAVRFEVDAAGNFTETFDADALRLIDGECEVEPACRCGALYCDDCRGSVRRAS